MDSAPRPDAAPRALGRYELLFRIASGGMAEVYAARVKGEAGFQKLLAVKRMLPQLADDEDFVTMFLDEARLAAHIESPHVVSTLDLGRAEDGSLYIVMELVVGVTLARVLRQTARARTPVPVGTAVELITQAAQGLHDAHEAVTPLGAPLQIVHRDVSPQNILVGVDGRVRLTDFGVARAVLRVTQTVGGQIKGKFAYCSPEQLRRQDVDRRSDLFSLGVVAWESLTHQRLFVGEHPVETIERVRSMPIPEVHQVRGDVPEPVSEVVMRALDRDPTKRFDDAHAFAEALRSAARGAGVALPPRAELTRFVRKAGGETLQKIRDNIRQALSETGEVGPLPSGVELIELTPSSSSGVVEREPSQPTDPNSTAHDPSFPEPDASAPGPGARNPSSLLPAAAEPEEPPTTLMARDRVEPGVLQEVPIERRRGAGAWILAAVGAILLVGIGAAVYILLASESGDGTVIELEPRPAPEPAAPAVAEPVEHADPEPAMPDEAPEPEDVDGEDIAPVAAEADPEPSAPVARETRRVRRVGSSAAREAREVSEPQEAEQTAPAPRVESTSRMRAEPRETPTSTMSSTSMGLRGLDAFDRDLERRQ